MSHVRIVVIALLGLGMVSAARAQSTLEPDKKQEAAIRKIQLLLDEPLIEAKDFSKEMPLGKFLDAVENRLPKGKQMTLRIDRDALGDKYAAVAATPMGLPDSPKTASLRMVLDRVRSKAKRTIDYRVEPAGVVLTTPKQAVFTAVYDIRDIVDKPERAGLFGAAFRNAEPAQKAALVVRSLVASLDPDAERSAVAEYESIEVVNGTRLVIRAGGARQAEFAQLIPVFHTLGDLSVVMKAWLIEVDEPYYKKLKSAKRVSIEEAERIFLEGVPAKGDSFSDWLKKQTLMVAGAEIKVNNGQEAGLLSKHQVIACRPGPEQLRKAEKGPQLVFEGVAFLAEARITPDRRYLRMKITEKATELQHIEKVKVWVDQEKQADAEVPQLAETTHTQTREIADGGTILIPVHFRPRSVKEKDRWLVLAITCRIRMEAEERHIRAGSLQDILPQLVADVLKNPALKATRDFYGTPGDKRFALVDSDAWTWSKTQPLSIAGHLLTPAKREGQQLLGMRVEKADIDEGKITLTLFNAGGTKNGAAIGISSLRFSARQSEKGWTVELAETLDP